MIKRKGYGIKRGEFFLVCTYLLKFKKREMYLNEVIYLVGKLEKLCRLKNISLLDLSIMTNINYKILEQFNNDLYILNDKQLMKISRKLGCSCHDLFFSDELKISLKGLNEIQIKNIIMLYESFKKKE
ncbi:hypothetical protein B5F14_09520 [Faecalitalea cylindroides]|uniref:HTH cro/C1-type domain-containing protein n=1 Tax=Faecalitalea cylindroides TaxID=39483 RepID=A0A1Y4LLR2_9FIRM|nr:helix-turn-helix domain-containing protein [Faecalitalea cylindroides]OUP56810.1 hypothetical protein B5F14_09520 [Faecalitalea cylindroides]